MPFFVARCEEMGIEILPPDVNLSGHEFTVVERRIRFGLDAVKGVGYQAVEAIKRAREEGGSFSSLWDFCERVDGRAVNKKAIEALIKCGALGSTGATRRGMLEVLEQAQGAGQKAQQDARSARARSSTSASRRRSRSTRASAPCARRSPTGEFDQRGAARGREGGDRPVHLRAPAEAVREALRARVDCPLSALGERRDKDWRDDRRDHHARPSGSARATATA